MTADEFLIDIQVAAKGQLNPEQQQCLLNGIDKPAFIVAGPGSGKTRVLVQRALRHVVLDRILPENVIITTFTRKAAREIRTRLVQWGEPLLVAVRARALVAKDGALSEYLSRVDVNRFVTGTLDSLCEEAIEISRKPSEPRYTLLDEFAARTLLARKGELDGQRKSTPALDQFLADFRLDGEPPQSTGEAAKDLKFIADRVIHDLVGDAAFQDGANVGRHSALAVVKRYSDYMEATAQLDFARLERTIWQRLRDGRAVGALSQAKAVLVDEYQDTNLLQEQIYFEIVKRQSAAFTVVGDDDQSLYRFRGATIELFRDFSSRAKLALGCGDVSPIYLKRNYRSSEDIVGHFNKFIKNDGDFSPGARVQPLKPEITAEGGVEAFPILGIFRDDPVQLAEAVGDFLHDVFVGAGRKIPGSDHTIKRDPKLGNFGDAVLLSKSVNEFGRAAFGNPPAPKFTHHLRLYLEAKGVKVFNPRGRPLRDVVAVQQLLGLVLETIDPSTESQPEGALVAAPDSYLRNEAKRVFLEWRQAAANLIATNPKSLGKTSLADKLADMRKIAKGGTGSPRDWPLLDAVYAYVPFIPPLSDDPEHQVYLEAVSRAAAQMVSFSAYRGLIYRTPPHDARSKLGALRDMLAPLAEGDIDIDEDIFSDVPRACLNMMTIHQAKGLEFPLVIVDVSSECKTNHQKQRFKRFPEAPSGTTALEDAFATFTDIGPLRMKRSALQRSFEDVIREYYVAYSRPQAALLIIGNLKAIQTQTKIKHLGHFWRANGTWPWLDGMPTKKPNPIPNVPFILL